MDFLSVTLHVQYAAACVSPVAIVTVTLQSPTVRPLSVTGATRFFAKSHCKFEKDVMRRFYRLISEETQMCDQTASLDGTINMLQLQSCLKCCTDALLQSPFASRCVGIAEENNGGLIFFLRFNDSYIYKCLYCSTLGDSFKAI